MLKASRVLLAVLAALGMSSAIAQTAPAVGGFNTTTSGNTTTHTYAPSGASDLARLSRRPFVPGGGDTSEFEALMNKKGYTPKGTEYDYKVTKPVPNASIAKAIGKTLPVVGNLLAMKELLDTLYADNVSSFDTGSNSWGRPVSSFAEYCLTGAGQGCYGQTKFPSVSQALASFNGSVTNNGWPWSCSLSNAGNVAPDRMAFALSSCVPTDPLGRENGNPEGQVRHHVVGQGEAVTSLEPVSVSDLENKLSASPTIPPSVDDLIGYIPPEALQRLAQDTAADTSNKPRAVPTTPSGVESPDGLTVPEATTTTSGTDSQGNPYTRTTQAETIVRTLPSGQLQHDTKTTTTTTTQTGTNPDGSPITNTTTSTETTTTTPAPPGAGPQTPLPPKEIITCGLPNTPPCKIDESGTPPPGDANFDAANAEIESFRSGLYEALQAKLDEIVHEWTWTFQLPTGCAALQFDTRVGPIVEIDMCQWQPMIHDIMSMLWAAAGVWGALMIFLRANG